jgi:hypothetical protein
MALNKNQLIKKLITIQKLIDECWDEADKEDLSRSEAEYLEAKIARYQLRFGYYLIQLIDMVVLESEIAEELEEEAKTQINPLDDTSIN